MDKSLSAEDKEFVESIDKEYYKRVHTSEDYYKRKRLILQNLDRLQKKVEVSAKSYDDFNKMRFIVMEKARHKKQVIRNFSKIETEIRKKQQSMDGQDTFESENETDSAN